MPEQSAHEQLADRMRDLSITVDVLDGPSARRANAEGWAHYAWSFRLSIAGDVLLNHATYCIGNAETKAEPVDIFGSILSDCSTVEPYANTDEDEERNVWPQTRSAWPDGWDQWASDFGFLSEPVGRAGLRRFADDFREIMCRRALIRRAIGDDAYAQLLEIQL